VMLSVTARQLTEQYDTSEACCSAAAEKIN
jgi:hypothetical protein